MEITDEQRSTLIALCCQMAWADGKVTEEERASVVSLLERIGWSAEDELETEAWLERGGPEVDISTLPEGLGQFAIYEVMRVMEADGVVDDRETALVQRLLGRLYEGVGGDQPLARVALTKRKVNAPE